MSLYSFDKSEKILTFDEVNPKHKITAYNGSYQYETLVLEHTGSIQELQNQNIELRTYTSASHLQSLKNTINSKRHISSYYDYDAISGSADFKIISMPRSILKEGIVKQSVSMTYYMSGSKHETIQDNNVDGVLWTSSGDPKGIVLYEEGFIILTGSIDGSSNSWHDWSTATTSEFAWDLEFRTKEVVPSLTLFAHAKKGHLNHSNNPSKHKTAVTYTTGSNQVIESEVELKNVTKTSYEDPEPLFKKETYISKIAIYDEERNIIGYANLAKPVRKTEDRDFTFKIKVDL